MSYSAIYQGQVRHRRYVPREHGFSYGLYMLALDTRRPLRELRRVQAQFMYLVRHDDCVSRTRQLVRQPVSRSVSAGRSRRRHVEFRVFCAR